jgi:hypothetical protein
LIKRHDGKYPWSYLDKPLELILKKIDMTTTEFDSICDRFTNKSLFLQDKDGQLIRDSSNSLIKINYENLKE